MSLKPFIRGIKRLIISVIKNDFFGMAAEMGFMLVIGIFPFMLFLMAVFGWMGNKSYMDPILIFLSTIMPEQSMDLILTVLSEVMIFSQGKLMAAIGIIVTLFLSTNAVAVVLKGLNRAYKVEETRNFIYTRLLSLIMVFVNTMIMFLTINLIIFGKVIINYLVNHLHITNGIGIMLLTIRWPIAFLALYVMAFLIYYILPDLRGNEKFKRASALPGTFFFLFILASRFLGIFDLCKQFTHLQYGLRNNRCVCCFDGMALLYFSFNSNWRRNKFSGLQQTLSQG